MIDWVLSKFFFRRRDLIYTFILVLGLSLFIVNCGGPDNTGQLPAISSISTATGLAEGPVTGGTSVTIQGKNFADDAFVSFGDQLASNVSVPTLETIVATTAPVFISGPTSVTITTTGQVTSQSDAFRFTPVIAFTSNRDGDDDIYLMEIDGKGVRPLTINTLRDDTDPGSLIQDRRPSFSYDGMKIVFESNRTGKFDLFTIGRNGQEPTNLTLDPADDQSAVFSPDGKELVFVSNRLNASKNSTEDFEIFRMDPDGNNLIQLTQNVINDREPIFSPDGSKIAFSSVPGGNSDISIMNRDGSGVQKLTSHSAKDSEPVFSPDGSQIVFSSNRDGDFNLYVIDKDGSKLQQLTTHSKDDIEPGFLPLLSGRKIIFTSKRTGNDELFVMNCVGTATRYITSCDAATITNLSLHAKDDREASTSP